MGFVVFEDQTVIILKMVVATCSVIEFYQRFGRPYCLHYQVDPPENLKSYLAYFASSVEVFSNVLKHSNQN